MFRTVFLGAALCSAILATASGAAEAMLPRIVGAAYLDARQRLQQLGYVPVTLTRHAESLCVDERCAVTKKVAEGFCASDVPSCVFYWRAPSGRYLRVDTQGEGRVKVARLAWVTRNEVRRQKIR